MLRIVYKIESAILKKLNPMVLLKNNTIYP